MGYTVKCANNELFKLREKDNSFRGKNALSNVRIKSLLSDVKTKVKEYHPFVGDDPERSKCLKQIGCIIRHHCGDHSLCFQEHRCTYLRVKNANPAWTVDEINAESVKSTKRHKMYMDLSKRGIEVLEALLGRQFNTKTIDHIAPCGCSNRSEGFWADLVVLSEGKRIQGNGTDLWLSMVELCFCMNSGNKEKTREELAVILGVLCTEVEKDEWKRRDHKRMQGDKRLRGEEGKMRRQLAKLTQDHRLGKDANKSRHHKSEKVPLRESAKSRVDKCTKCGCEGHKTRECVVIRAPKRQKKLLHSWKGEVLSTSAHVPRLKRNKPHVYNWSNSTLLSEEAT